MDIASLATAFDTASIVSWFALLIVVFAVFIVLGIYENCRTAAQQRDAEEAVSRKRARQSRPQAQRKEYT